MHVLTLPATSLAGLGPVRAGQRRLWAGQGPVRARSGAFWAGQGRKWAGLGRSEAVWAGQGPVWVGQGRSGCTGPVRARSGRLGRQAAHYIVLCIYTYVSVLAAGPLGTRMFLYIYIFVCIGTRTFLCVYIDGFVRSHVYSDFLIFSHSCKVRGVRLLSTRAPSIASAQCAAR